MRKMLLLLGFWLFSVVGGEHPMIQLSAQEGGQVKISCRYDSGYETYPKYFCKGDYGLRKTLGHTKDKKCNKSPQKEKYKLCDDTNQGILYVTINNLNLNDGGTYWCEIDTSGFDPKTEIQLEVYKAPAPQKPPSVPFNPPTVTAVRANTRNQQQSATPTGYLNLSKSARSTTSTPSAEMHTVAGKELYLAAAAAVPLLSLLVVLYFSLSKHRHDREKAVSGCDAGPRTHTSSTQLIHLENHSQGQLRELDPSVSVSSPDSMYATVTSRRSPDVSTSIYHPVSTQTRMVNPEFDLSSSSRLQDDSSAQMIKSRTSTQAGDQHISEDVRLVYSTACFSTEGSMWPREQTRSAAGPSEVYATIRRPET